MVVKAFWLCQSTAPGWMSAFPASLPTLLSARRSSVVLDCWGTRGETIQIILVIHVEGNDEIWDGLYNFSCSFLAFWYFSSSVEPDLWILLPFQHFCAAVIGKYLRQVLCLGYVPAFWIILSPLLTPHVMFFFHFHKQQTLQCLSYNLMDTNCSVLVHSRHQFFRLSHLHICQIRWGFLQSLYLTYFPRVPINAHAMWNPPICTITSGKICGCCQTRA